MYPAPVPDPGSDGPVRPPSGPDTDLMMDDERWAARLGAGMDEEEPGDPEIGESLDSGVPAELAGMPAEVLAAEAREFTAQEIQAAGLAGAGLLGAGLLGAMSARRRGPVYSAVPDQGEHAGRWAGLAHGGLLDQAVPGGALAMLAEDAAGPGNGSYAGASDDEIVGLICVFDRLEAWAAGRKYAAAGEFIRRRPADNPEKNKRENKEENKKENSEAQEKAAKEVQEPGGLAGMWDEFAATELAHSLGDGRGSAEMLLDTAHALHRYGVGEDTQDRRVLAFLEKFGLAGDLPGAHGNGDGGNGGGSAGGGNGNGGAGGGNGNSAGNGGSGPGPPPGRGGPGPPGDQGPGRHH
jgi:hypothetical protein